MKPIRLKHGYWVKNSDCEYFRGVIMTGERMNPFNRYNGLVARLVLKITITSAN